MVVKFCFGAIGEDVMYVKNFDESALCDMISVMVPIDRKLILQARDIAILQSFFESRLMTIGQAAEILFDGRRASAQQRLWKLKSEGFLAELEREPSAPSVMHLSAKGLRLLKRQGILLDYPPKTLAALNRRARGSELTRGHELAVMEVKASIHRAARAAPAVTIEEFVTWPQLLKFEALGAETSPDGFFLVHDTHDGPQVVHSFYVEIDLGTEQLATLVLKAARYLDHYRSGGFASANGAARAAYRAHPFRVLFVLPNDERRNNTAEALLLCSPPVLSHVWLAALPEVIADPFGKVWIRPLDYREATAGTPFAPSAEGRRRFRSAARNALVADRVERHTLFARHEPRA